MESLTCVVYLLALIFFALCELFQQASFVTKLNAFTCSHSICHLFRSLFSDNGDFKHDVYGRWQTAKITSDFLFFSCNP